MTRRQGFSNEERAVADARRFAAETLAGEPASIADSVLLMVSELATNAIKHARSPFEVEIDVTDGQVRVEVSDAGPGRPVLRAPSLNALSGRGLQIVDLLATTWGVDDGEQDKRKAIWFTLESPREGALRRSESAREPSGSPRTAKPSEVPWERSVRSAPGSTEGRGGAILGVLVPPTRTMRVWRAV